MYVYSQGRRIQNRAFSSPHELHKNVAVQTENHLDYYQIEKLLEECLSLWAKTEQTMHELIERGGSPKDARSEETKSFDSQSLASDSLLKSKNDVLHRSKGLQVEIADCLRRFKSQQSRMQKDLCDLELDRPQSTNQKLHMPSDSHEDMIAIRRYNFVDHGKSLMSTVRTSAVTSASPQIRTLQPFFYEVKMSASSSGRLGPETFTPRDHRYCFTEIVESKYNGTKCRLGLKRSSLESQDSEKVEKVLEWLLAVQPRTYLDVEPMLVLAKDVLKRVATECLIRLKSEQEKCEKEVAILKVQYQKSIDDLRNELATYKFESQQRTHQIEEDHSKQLEDLRCKSQDSILYQVTFPMTLLRFRNVVLQRRNFVLKQTVSDLQSRSLLEKVFELQSSDKLTILRSLLETSSLITDLTTEFFLHSSISEVSIISLCQKMLCVLELRHGGRSTWLHIVSQILMTNPSRLGKRVLSWYRHEAVLKEGITVENSVQMQLKETFWDDALSKLRDDIISKKKDVWDALGFILEVPKEKVFADTLGLHSDDIDVVLELWPDFLMWLEEHKRVALSIPDLSLQDAMEKLKESALWNKLSLRHAIRRYDGFDLESLPPSTRFSLEETYELVAAIHCQKEKDPSSDSLPMPLFIRHFAIQKTNLRSSASRFLLRLQCSVKSYYKGNTRIRTFGRVTGMVHPLRYFDCCERFLRTFWKLLLKIEMGNEKQGDHGQPPIDNLTAWMAADRAIDFRHAILAASRAFQAVLHQLPNASIMPAETEYASTFLSASIHVLTGSKLPMKDLEKLALNTISGQEQQSRRQHFVSDEFPLSLDLVSELVLDMFLKLVRKWEDAFSALWTEHLDNWDWGSKENSPDLDSLRLFLAKQCNSKLEGHELVSLFADLTNYSDDIDHEHAARICFRHLHNSKHATSSCSEILYSDEISQDTQLESCSTQNQGLEYMHAATEF